MKKNRKFNKLIIKKYWFIHVLNVKYNKLIWCIFNVDIARFVRSVSILNALFVIMLIYLIKNFSIKIMGLFKLLMLFVMKIYIERD
jgi:hypothetical protein